jgi:hypothetical protein
MNKSFNTLFVHNKSDFQLAIEQLIEEENVNSDIQNIQTLSTMVDVAVEDANTLMRLSHLVEKQNIDKFGLEQIGITVGSICQRQGMDYKPSYFALENINGGINYAVEGIGSFLKSIWDAIISAIKRMIDWMSNLFGGGSSGGGGGGSSIAVIERKIEEVENTTQEIKEIDQEAVDRCRQQMELEAPEMKRQTEAMNKKRAEAGPLTTVDLVNGGPKEGHDVNGNDTGVISKQYAVYTNLMKKLGITYNVKDSVTTALEKYAKLQTAVGTICVVYDSFKIQDISVDSERDINIGITDELSKLPDFHRTETGASFSSVFHNCNFNITEKDNNTAQTTLEITPIGLANISKLSVNFSDFQHFSVDSNSNSFKDAVSHLREFSKGLKIDGVKFSTGLKRQQKEIESLLKEDRFQDNNGETTALKEALHERLSGLTIGIKMNTLLVSELRKIIEILNGLAKCYVNLVK